MSFVLQRVTARGLVLNQVSGDALRIGRGTNAELRSDNPAVSLDHAVIEGDAAGFLITDKGSITGTYVNRKPVESARLAKGDVIEIGDLRIEVQLAERDRPLFLRVVSTVAKRRAGGDVDDEEEVIPAAAQRAGGTVKAPKIDYVSAFKLDRPYFTKLSLIALIAIIALAVVAQVTQPGHQTWFMPGSISSAHARAGPNGQPIGHDCMGCHDPWNGVTDQRCMRCHNRAPHAAAQAVTPPCISCHPEHRGDPKLAMTTDTKCIGCHRDLQAHVKAGVRIAPAIATIAVFGDKHPDFTWPPDRDTLRFNHKLHLKAGGIFNAQGHREVLECTTCHKLVVVRDKAEPKPVTFAADCQRCHKLTFDLRFPDAEAPHGGDPGLVYGFVATYASGNRNIVGKSPEEIRRILSSRPAAANADERAVVNAEHVIKTKCALCHDIQRSGARLAVAPPVLSTRWMTRVSFTHDGAHRRLQCESCHENARQSAKTADVLMPTRKNCVACHGGGGAKTASTCLTCHRYHEQSRNAPAKLEAGIIH